VRRKVYISNRPAYTYNYYLAETTTAPLQRSINYHLIYVVKKIIADCYENNKQHIECGVCGKTKGIFVLKYGAYGGRFTLNIS
jgi:hypothetical protein